jgi:PAS domain S-box-containing protein
MWPGVWLGAFVSNAITQEPIYTAAGIAVGNTLGPLLGAYLLRRFVGFDNALERLRDVLGIVLLGSALAMTVTATNGVLNLALAGIVHWPDYGSVWWLWWIGDAMGVLLVAPLILTWSSFRRQVEIRERNPLEISALIVALAATTWLSFISNFPFAYPLYPCVIWTALRFGQRATTLAIAAISAFAIWGTTHGLGPFTVGSLDQRLIFLVTFMAVLALTGLVLGAVTAEGRSAREQLEVAERRFQVLAEIVPQMAWSADATGWIDWHNHRWYEYTGQAHEEAAGWGWQRAYHPDDYPRVMEDWPRSIATGAPFNMESRIRRNDGTFRWFLVRAEPLRARNGSVVRWYGTNTDIDDQKQELQQTTRVARTLQAAFLPGKLPTLPDLKFDALYLTAESEALIGGDWYDAFELPGGNILVTIGDVIGHGVGAAVTAGRIRQGIFAMAFDATDPAAILGKVNRMLRFQEATVATAVVAFISSDLATMRYASAGHPPPIIASSSLPVQSLPYGGAPLGVAPTLELQNHTVQLDRGAVILFYTDGITEFKRDIAAAETALHNAVAKLVSDPASAHPAVDLQRAVMGSEQPTDDAVLMVVQLAPAKTATTPSETELSKKWTFHSSDPYYAHTSRHELMEFIRRFVVSDDELFRIELIFGEILANTVEHAPGLVRIEIDWRGSRPVVTILDDGPGLMQFSPKLPESELGEDGRGLFLIGTLAGDVQVEGTQNAGTKMTVVLPVSRAGA